MKVCFKCGVKHLTEKQILRKESIWFNQGVCVECKEVKPVTDDRHYNNLKKKW